MGYIVLGIYVIYYNFLYITIFTGNLSTIHNVLTIHLAIDIS